MQCPYCKEEIIDGAIKCKHCGSTIGFAEQSRPAGDNEFGAMFSRGLDLWKANMGDLAVLTLVFMLVVWIPIANIGFVSGYTRSLLKVARGKGKAQVGDIFGSWDCFGNLFVFFLINLIIFIVLHSIPVLGSLASIALGFVVVPGAFLIIDRGAGVIDAYKWCIETVQADFINWLLVYLVGNLITCAGLAVLFIGVILSAPLGQLIIIQQYERVKPGGEAPTFLFSSAG
jgi:hypothetical protein